MGIAILQACVGCAITCLLTAGVSDLFSEMLPIGTFLCLLAALAGCGAMASYAPGFELIPEYDYMSVAEDAMTEPYGG